MCGGSGIREAFRHHGALEPLIGAAFLQPPQPTGEQQQASTQPTGSEPAQWANAPPLPSASPQLQRLPQLMCQLRIRDLWIHLLNATGEYHCIHPLGSHFLVFFSVLCFLLLIFVGIIVLLTNSSLPGLKITVCFGLQYSLVVLQ